jgi:hypothetical protein
MSLHLPPGILNGLNDDRAPRHGRALHYGRSSLPGLTTDHALQFPGRLV